MKKPINYLMLFLAIVLLVMLVQYNEKMERIRVLSDNDIATFSVLSPAKRYGDVITQDNTIKYSGEDETKSVSIHIVSCIYPKNIVPPNILQEYIIVPDYNMRINCEVAGRKAHIYQVGDISQMVCAVSPECCIALIYKPREFSDEDVINIAEDLYVFKEE